MTERELLLSSDFTSAIDKRKNPAGNGGMIFYKEKPESDVFSSVMTPSSEKVYE